MSGHVSMMNDVLIMQLPPEILRSTLRHIVSQAPEARSLFSEHVKGHFRTTPPAMTAPSILVPLDGSTHALEEYLRLSVPDGSERWLIASLIHLVQAIPLASATWAPDSQLERILETSSADIVQAVQAIKEAPSHPADLKALLVKLLEALDQCNDYCLAHGLSQPYVRTQLQVSDCLSLLYPAIYLNGHAKPNVPTIQLSIDPEAKWTGGQVDKVDLGPKLCMPRMLNGFWQMSSPAWGSASGRKMDEALLDLASKGLVAADMADHYGDAELLYGSFRNRLPAPLRDEIICATKWCLFTSPVEAITREWVLQGVLARSKRVGGTVELLQFHWQDYSNSGYLQAIEYLVELTHTRPELVTAIGLCNFDAKRTEEVCQYMIAQTGSVGIVSNQVQFSLIDSRPVFGMAKVCETYGLKLLTYGSFCGGFLSDRWLDQPPPVIYDQIKPLNPSQRKYLDMIYEWGSWEDFGALLRILRIIADKHQVDVSNVATRWVLQRPETGCVIVGTRLGVSNNAAANLKAFTFELDPEEIAVIEDAALGAGREKALALYKAVGDCGQEYR